MSALRRYVYKFTGQVF